MRNDLTGTRFGRLVAQRPTGEKRWGVFLWECLCDCGQIKVAASNSLRSGLVQSCGCLLSERAAEKALKHGMYGSPTYKCWGGMIQRCTNPKSTAYERYGALGVAVCDRWQTFDNFLADMGPVPDGMSIDRIDSTKGYEPDNCRWATVLRQARNKRRATTTFEQAEEVRRLYASGMKPKAIVEATGLSKGSVNGIVYLGQITAPDDF